MPASAEGHIILQEMERKRSLTVCFIFMNVYLWKCCYFIIRCAMAIRAQVYFTARSSKLICRTINASSYPEMRISKKKKKKKTHWMRRWRPMDSQHWSHMDSILTVYMPVMCGCMVMCLLGCIALAKVKVRLSLTVDKLLASPSN